MTVRARLLHVPSTCTAETGQVIDVRQYQDQGTETQPDAFSRGGQSPITLEHPSGIAVDVTDLVERGKIIIH